MADSPAATPCACPFCKALKNGGRKVLAHNRHAVAIPDRFPLSRGHTLVVPRRHVASLAALSPSEAAAVWKLALQVRRSLSRKYRPAGFNLGLNDGPAAGQTVPHLHLHVIPRYRGDARDPRGGVRWVLPRRAAYWKSGR